MKTEKYHRKLWLPVIALLAVGSLAWSGGICAAQSGQNSAQQTPAKAPPADPQKPKGQPEANPFPEDTNSVPVLPSNNSLAQPAAPDAGDLVPLPDADNDPVKSPDDSARAPDVSGASSSSAGLDNLLKPPPEEEQKHRRAGGQAIEHPESAKEDESVGSYYLDQKNWRAARSRFESALVLDPDNPDVYWGLAESERHLGDFAGAKGNYLKVVEYDPDSKHGKEAKKILQEPEIESAKAVSAAAPGPQPH